jgi:hypothetical protein
VRRLFWTGLGLGFGAAAAVGAMRWAERTREALKPTSLVDRAADGADELRERLTVAFSAGRQAMAERERELRASLGVDGEAT